MLWYGPLLPRFFKRVFSRQKRYLSLKRKLVSLNLVKSFSWTWSPAFVYFPKNWLVILLSPKVIHKRCSIFYCYSAIYYYKLPTVTRQCDVMFDPLSSVLTLQDQWKSSFFSFFWRQLKLLFRGFSASFFMKLKIKGKGYYIYKSYRNTITHQLGHSHRVYIYGYNTSVKFLSKTTILLFGSSKTDIRRVGGLIRTSRRINIFTGRGVRFVRQVIYKKVGKVSSYR